MQIVSHGSQQKVALLRSLNLMKVTTNFTRWVLAKSHNSVPTTYCHIIQRGQPHTAAATCTEINEQVWMAMHGYSEPVKTLQTATGTKDKIAQHRIEILLAKAQKMKVENPGRSTDENAEELAKWYQEQPGDKMNQLLLLESETINHSQYCFAQG
jgi:hypothetical protein